MLSDSKINGKQVFPHEITTKLLGEISSIKKFVYQKQWDAIKDFVVELAGMSKDTGFKLSKLIAMSDVSGSMNAYLKTLSAFKQS